MSDEEIAAKQREAILARRSRFIVIAAALGMAGAPILACEPEPCLSPPRPPQDATAASEGAAG